MRYRQAATALLLALSTDAVLAAQDAYPPGTFQFPAEIDLHLQPTEVFVPSQFKGQFSEDPVLNLPPGFTASVFATTSSSGRPRMLAFNDEGVLHVAHSNNILALPDLDDDGVADRIVTAADGFSWINDIAFYQGDLYAAETDQVIRYRDLDGDLVYEERQVLVEDIPSDGWHTSRAIAFNPDSGKFYLAIGSPCDLCRLDEPVLGYSTTPINRSDEWDAILEFNADGSGRRIFATGMRNVVGLDMHPQTKELWGTHNHYDLGGPHLPPEWIDVIRDGDFQGYPLAFGYQVWVDFTIPGYDKILPLTRADSLRVQSMKRPTALVPAHQAPLGIHIYNHALFPPQYRHAAFVALHGGQVSGNLSVVPGFKVVAIFAQGDGTDARMADFLTGFGPPHKQDVWGKPVGLAADGRGRLYVSSDTGARAIYRIDRSVITGSWEHSLPTTILSGNQLAVAATIHLERFDPDGTQPQVSADLSGLGGPADLPLQGTPEEGYRLQADLPIDQANGLADIIVWIRQENEAGAHNTQLVHSVEILPVADAVIATDGLEDLWNLVHSARVAVDLAAVEQTFSGASATALNATPSRLAGWNLEFQTERPFSSGGYKSLRFAFHPGTVQAEVGKSLLVAINKPSTAPSESPRGFGQYAPYGEPVNLLQGGLGGGVHGFEIDLQQRQWQLVEIPLDAMQLSGPVQLIRFFGNVAGTFYLDDLRLVSRAEPPTAVTLDESIPSAFTLEQNFPNPFNSGTAIRFSLPTAAELILTIYNLQGQVVARPVTGYRAAGPHQILWDGRDRRGRLLASGLYVYRLQTGTQEATRKLLLLR
ncbi:MAG: T9SS type A sorting domain-containing protein [Candidatus Latescibacteria bacterium]|nr:T9SS type A sorting domain-containing protein [Candidatus Latescibacterota bacterium]